jgi:hypothetical protein
MNKLPIAYVTLVFVLLLSGCGGTKVLKDPEPLVLAEPLATGSDRSIATSLDWVIVRDGPGTWAKNANWDEYLLRVANLSDRPIEITRIVVVDSLDTRIDSLSERKPLVKGSKETVRRYKRAGIEVEAGSGRGVLRVAGATAAGAAIGAMTATGGIMGGAGMGAAAGGVVVLVPVLAVGGVIRGVNNSKVNSEIEDRQTVLPIMVPAGSEQSLDVFFPIAPSPALVELSYADNKGAHSILVDTSTVLENLHIATQNQ